jgi:hypothetical protein
MKEIDRRSVLTGILCGAAVATVGLAVMPKAVPAFGYPQNWSCEA